MEELRQRLLSQIEVVPGPLATDCWLFRTSTGHPNLWWRGLTSRASRYSYLAFVGAITGGHYICHRCDEPRCVNPSHLFQGTPSDNVQDAIAKGRFDPVRRKLARLAAFNQLTTNLKEQRHA